jgi:hypothetical protein
MGTTRSPGAAALAAADLNSIANGRGLHLRELLLSGIGTRPTHALYRLGCNHGAHARRDPSRVALLTGRPTPNLALPPGSRQHHSMPPPPSATYQRLRQTIAERMRMCHIYQPRRRTRPAGSWERMVGKVHLQRHHPMRAGQLRPGGRRGAEQRRARPAAGGLPPAPRCLPPAAGGGGGLFAR